MKDRGVENCALWSNGSKGNLVMVRIRFSNVKFVAAGLCFCALLLVANKNAVGQTYGIELQNSLMPASGGMAGASLTQPQDFMSVFYGNPATLAQYKGTQFTFSGAWVEPTVNVTQNTPLPLVGVTPFAAKSQTPGSALGNFAVIQDLGFLGIDGTTGFGFLVNAGLGADYRQVPASNGTQLTYLAFDIANAVGIQVTERFSFGSTFFVGTSYLDGPFNNSSSVQVDYGVRGTGGFNYELGRGTSIGGFWQSKKRFTFDDFFRPGGIGPFEPLTLEHPETLGIGIANRCLMNGRLLVAADVLWKRYSDAATLQSLYKDQLGVMFGTQYIVGPRLKLRAGYGWNENPMLETVPGTIAGLVPIGGIPAVQYVQAQFAAIGQHRITGGFQIKGVMPNCDLDFMAGGMFENSESFGNTTSSFESYWLAFGLTWRFGNCQSGGCCVPSEASGSTADSSFGPQSEVLLQQ
jgi:long-chain fatty acid transport protein